MTKRPFEVGDLVLVSYCLEPKEWGIILTIREDGIIINSGNDRFYCEDNEVFTIRKPRKGGKEARDICAMLARELHHELLKAKLDAQDRIADWTGIFDPKVHKLNSYWLDRKNGQIAKYHVRRLRKAKSMLQVQS